jgi:hypothetical protein
MTLCREIFCEEKIKYKKQKNNKTGILFSLKIHRFVDSIQCCSRPYEKKRLIVFVVLCVFMFTC